MPRTEADFRAVEPAEKIKSGINTIALVAKKPMVTTEKPTNPKYIKRWYKKNEPAALGAQAEVFAQEIMRLLSPVQPKTRRIDTHMVLSQAVEGFQSFKVIGLAQVKERLFAGSITGLGQVLVGALLLNEIDLSPENMGINPQGQVVKLDGGMCFADITRTFSKAGPITADDLQRLPNIEDYKPYNWLKIIEHFAATKTTQAETKRHVRADLHDPKLTKAPFLRREVHQGILYSLLLTGASKIADLWVWDKRWRMMFLSKLEERQENLKSAAFQDGYFIEYLVSEQADKDAARHLAYLKDFKIKGKVPLMDWEVEFQYWRAFQDLKIVAKCRHERRLKEYGQILQTHFKIQFTDKQSSEDFQKTLTIFRGMKLGEKYCVINALVVYGYQQGFIAECKKIVAELLVGREGTLLAIETANTAYALLDFLDLQLLAKVREKTQYQYALTSPIDRSGIGIQNPLMVAVNRQDVEFAKKCLALGFDVNGRNRHELKTPIFYAVENKHAAMIDLLICEGADLYLRDAIGRQPLDILGVKNVAVLDFLMGKVLTLEPEVNVWDTYGVVLQLLFLAKERNAAVLKARTPVLEAVAVPVQFGSLFGLVTGVRHYTHELGRQFGLSNKP